VLGPGFADRGKYAVIPAADHPPLRQRMVLLKAAGPIAARFYAYLQGGAARAILKKHGFSVPG
jgi:molybdate transport system substrate-binding protein